jgi:hypothetical protein
VVQDQSAEQSRTVAQRVFVSSVTSQIIAIRAQRGPPFLVL